MGKRIVNELGLESGVDTLARWMASFIAEKIDAVEICEGEDKEKAQKECFELILNLWLHHAHYPSGKSPSERFDEIYDAVERMDPEMAAPYHSGLSQLYNQKKGAGETPESEPQNWVNHALQLDVINREMINFCLRQAIVNESDGETKGWLEDAAGLPGSNDADSLRELLFRSIDFEGESSEDEERDRKVEKLQKRIDQLNAFDSFRGQLLEIYEAEINSVESEK